MFKKTPNQSDKITLWGVKVSPYVRKVMVALAEKSINYEQQEILPTVLLNALGETVPVEFSKASPLGKIPLLQVGDMAIADSAVIAQYLDRKYPTVNALYPVDPEAYAKALWFEHYSDNVLTAVAYAKIFVERIVKAKVLKMPADEQLVEQAINDELPPLLDYLESASTETDWLAGQSFSMADVAIATQLLALQMAGFELQETQWPNLSAYFSRVIARPSFSECRVD